MDRAKILGRIETYKEKVRLHREMCEDELHHESFDPLDFYTSRASAVTGFTFLGAVVGPLIALTSNNYQNLDLVFPLSAGMGSIVGAVTGAICDYAFDHGRLAEKYEKKVSELEKLVASA